jgi:hypothetical protein
MTFENLCALDFVQWLEIFHDLVISRALIWYFLFAAHITDALQNDCAKCSEKQKAGAEKVIKFLYKNKQEQWKLLQEKYDPENTYIKKYEDKLKDVTS